MRNKFRQTALAILAGGLLMTAPGCGLGAKTKAADALTEAAVAFPGNEPGPASVSVEAGLVTLETSAIRAQWAVVGGRLKPVGIWDLLNNASVPLTGDAFAIVLGDKTTMNSSDMTVTHGPSIHKISGHPDALRRAERADGQEVTCTLHDSRRGLSVQWKAQIRDGGSYVRQIVTILPASHDVTIGRVILFDEPAGDARQGGDVQGSPLLIKQLFVGFEHPMAQNAIAREWTPVGKWGKDQIKKEEFTTLTYAVPVALRKSGLPLDVQFEATDGDNSLDIDRVTLLADGQDVSHDAHAGDTGDIDEHNIYRVTVPELKGREKLEVVAHVKGDHGHSTIGDVTMSTPPVAPRVQCALDRNAPLKAGESLETSLVFGVTPEGQSRRGFLYYIDRERAHAYRPFLHYNSWYDVGYFGLRYSEADCVNVVETFNRELVEKRGATMKSYLWDDGWDDPKTLWGFNPKLPHGFTAVEAAANKHGADIGMWLSPFGGYGPERKARLETGAKEGFEINSAGFSLAGPKYYKRFHDITLKFVHDYHANQFKFDGISASAGVDGSQTRDGDAMLRLIADLRAARPDLFINQTTGTWPSPFWLRYVDSIWRGGEDNDFIGTGSDRQRWITYRDADTYRRVVTQGPLYPLNSLMLHGIVLATHAKLGHGKLTTASDDDFRDEARSYFGTGTQLQELYITPSLMNDRKWDDLAAAAKWSASHSHTLVDTHWIGGDPSKGQAYGWAAWSGEGAVMTLRNPTAEEQTIEVSAEKAFELPAGVSQNYHLTAAYSDQRVKEIDLSGKTKVTITLKPYEVLVFDGTGR
jgi:hypothetical protein